jgi:hypothetical protein
VGSVYGLVFWKGEWAVNRTDYDASQRVEIDRTAERLIERVKSWQVARHNVRSAIMGIGPMTDLDKAHEEASAAYESLIREVGDL